MGLLIVVAFIAPQILAGWNPTLVSLAGVRSILALIIYFVPGLNWSTTATLAGTLTTVLLRIALVLRLHRLESPNRVRF